MTQNSPEQSGNIEEFKISSNSKDEAKDLQGGVVEFVYYESVLSNTVTATATIMETGVIADQKKDKGGGDGAMYAPTTVDSLPIRGGERTDITIEDVDKNQITFEDGLYINRVRDVDPGTQQDLYYLDFVSKECFANEQTRVTKRYEGSISQNVEKILKDVLKVEGELDVDETAAPYNFIGNDKKPFYICTWLASKSIPQVESEDGGNVKGSSAGYLFYQTKEGYHFKAIDKLFLQEPKKKYIYNNSTEMPPEYDAKVLSYDITSDIDVQENLMLGVYNTKSIFFDFYSFDYKQDIVASPPPKGGEPIAEGTGVQVKVADSTNPLGATKATELVPKEYTQSPSRMMTHILDVGTLPKGRTMEAQLEDTKDKKDKPNFDARDTMMQSIMRYNQMFTIRTDITIPGDFSLKAGDIVKCDFPEMYGAKSGNVNPESEGLYMIAHVCHRITPDSTLTSLSLVRDSYGDKV